ncbi:unnamed protein product [Rotaria magnacalcarata]|uniref:BED-type domain-containing protein n=1 Tax=Rotaria magnacalcarata TaxID=392030 RepID=A0A816AX82_9BILA|nr:unnamed protein product [Rotaria magnacalcarata]CAF1600398.1 unnamed protein product [Rotaria magnacalcarata]CAF4652480.1 unnamed protein product [Rotaria magnacalcarata]CAF4672067.1 unnamed protein product [Rotaria magnacalcarata]
MNIRADQLQTTEDSPSSSTGESRSSLLRIKDSNDVYEPFVQCTICQQILSYDVKNGTNSLKLHVQNCTKKINLPKSTMPIDCYTNKIAAVSSDNKRMVTLACSKCCAFDMRSFNSVHGDGFKQICQVLIDIVINMA